MWSERGQTLQWRHNEHGGVSNHQSHDCLLNRLFMRRTKKTSKLRVTGICAGNSPVTGEFPAEMASNSENVYVMTGMAGRRQAIIWTNAGILLIGPLGTNFIENLIEILTFPFTKMRLKVSSAKWRPFCLGLNVLKPRGLVQYWISVRNSS